MKRIKRLIIGLHFFVGIGAMAGGFAAISKPSGPMGISTDILKTGPFNDFLIPGLFLFCIIGLDNVGAGLLALKKNKIWPYATGFMGATLVIWIVVQCIILKAVAALHVIFFTFGAIQGLLALSVLWHDDLFPVMLIKKKFNITKK